MAGNFGFNQLDAACVVVFLEIGGGGKDIQLGRIGGGEGKFFRLFQRFVERVQRAVGQAGSEIALRQPESRGQIVRHQLADAFKRLGRLADNPPFIGITPFSKAKLGSSNGPFSFSTAFHERYLPNLSAVALDKSTGTVCRLAGCG